MKLLIVDDQEAVGTIIAQVVAQGGWESIYRSDAAGISDLIRQEKVDVLLIDYFMEGRTGLDIIESLRQDGFGLPIILFSGDTAAIDANRAARLNVLSILSKPLSIPQLRTTINQAKKSIPPQDGLSA
ncbi:MAG: response regulator [Verrucomicrobium sp.]|nr:response regulator [Verrucomicrobium sp.]